MEGQRSGVSDRGDYEQPSMAFLCEWRVEFSTLRRKHDELKRHLREPVRAVALLPNSYTDIEEI